MMSEPRRTSGVVAVRTGKPRRRSHAVPAPVEWSMHRWALWIKRADTYEIYLVFVVIASVVALFVGTAIQSH